MYLILQLIAVFCNQY